MKYEVSVGVIATDPPVKKGDVIDGSILGDALDWHVENGNVVALGDVSEAEPTEGEGGEDSGSDADNGDEGSETEGVTGGEKPVSKMNKAELLSLAESKGIEVPDGSTNDQIRAILGGGE